MLSLLVNSHYLKESIVITLNDDDDDDEDLEDLALAASPQLLAFAVSSSTAL